MAGLTTHKRGAALIVVLWVVAIIGTITMVFSRQSRLALKINRNIVEGTQAELLAEAGIYQAMAALARDKEETFTDHQSEEWYNSQQLFGDVVLGKGIFRVTHSDLDTETGVLYGLMDECGKLNLNTASREMLLALPFAEPEVVDALIDWRDEDEEISEFGAESEYYESLPEPYSAKNTQLDTIEEALLVKDMTLDLFYGEDTNTNGILDQCENDGTASYPLDNSDGVLNRGWYPYITCLSYASNVDAEGQPRINVNSASREELEEEFEDILTSAEINSIITTRDENNFESIGDLLSGESNGPLNREKFQQIADRITVSDEENLYGRININTAPAVVLKCLFPEEEGVAEAIVEYRQSEEGPFENIGEVLDVDGMTENLFRQIANQICVKSSVFSIRSAGYMPQSQAYREIFAILDRGGENPEIRYWKVIR